MTYLIREEARFKRGKMTLLCAEREDGTADFRLVYRGDDWLEDEWVRIDSEKSGVYLQLRRKLGDMNCEEATSTLKKVLKLIEKVEEVTSGGKEDQEK